VTGPDRGAPYEGHGRTVPSLFKFWPQPLPQIDAQLMNANAWPYTLEVATLTPSPVGKTYRTATRP